MEGWARILPDGAAVCDGEMWLGGCRIADLAEQYGTPLYLYDELTLRSAARHVRRVFAPLRARVSYASKACSIGGILRVLREEGLDLDVVSEGEIEAGLRAGFQPAQLHLHGNCKSDAELTRAVDGAVRTVVIDGLEEIVRLEEIAAQRSRTIDVMLRLTLPIEAITHPHLQTSGTRSKFGLQTETGEDTAAARALIQSSHLRLVGLHIHLGSQIDNGAIYRQASEDLVSAGQHWRRLGFEHVHELSVGGGWRVPYTPDEQSLSAEAVAEAIAPAFQNDPSFRPAVEPGRALVARAAMAVYKVGSVKGDLHRRVVAVEGGMGDNPRPALYGARYHAFLPVAPCAEPLGPADVVGRYCETGDTLASAVPLPEVRTGDLLAIPVSGAYHLSMASTYNLVPPPPAVLVARGEGTQILRRGTVGDLFAREPDQAR